MLNIATPEANRKKVEPSGKGIVNRSITAMNNPPPQYNFQDCDPFVLGSGNHYQPTQLAQLCSNTYSPTSVKLESLIINQSQGTNYDLLVYFYNHDTQALELVGGSVNSGSQDEVFSEVVPAGNYLLYAVPQSGGTTIDLVVGALGWSDYDAYEANENFSQATPVDGSGGNYILTGNSDNQNDLDYFVYTAPANESSVLIRLNSSAHIFQVYNGNTWVNVSPGATATINLGELGGSFYARVFFDPSTTVDPLVNYEVVFSRPAANIQNAFISGDVQPGWFPGTEVANQLTFGGLVVDQSWHPVPYAPNVVLSIASNEGGLNAVSATVNASGEYNQSLSIPNCSGPYDTALRWDYAYEVCWEVDYQYDQNHIWSFGLDTVSSEGVQYHHICNATLRTSIDFQACQ